jgi:hypothetical protein
MSRKLHRFSRIKYLTISVNLCNQWLLYYAKIINQAANYTDFRQALLSHYSLQAARRLTEYSRSSQWIFHFSESRIAVSGGGPNNKWIVKHPPL